MFMSVPVLLTDVYLWLAERHWGRELLEEGSPLLSKLLSIQMMGFFTSKEEVWRRKGLVRLALNSSQLVIEILSDPKRPEPVKRAFRGLVESFATAKKRERWRKVYDVAPVFAVIDWTNRCNFACYGCYANSYKEGADLSFEVVDRVITELKATFGVHFIVLSGGEPFLRWKDMADMAKKHRDVFFMVYTNGSLITPEVITGLSKLGNITPAISVEGFEAETDNRRGKGQFIRVSRLMDELKKAGVLFGFSATMTSQNADVLVSDEFIDFYIDKGCKYGWYFIYIPIGRNPDMTLMVTPVQRSHLADQINKWRRLARPIFLGDFWNDGWLVGGCIAAGRRYFHIDGQGNIKPCVFSPLAAANVRDVFSGRSKYTSILHVITNSPVFQRYRQVQKRIVDYTAPCPIIDHRDLLQEVWQTGEVTAVQSTPDGFFNPDGEIAQGLTRRSACWRTRSPRENYLKGGPYE